MTPAGKNVTYVFILMIFFVAYCKVQVVGLHMVVDYVKKFEFLTAVFLGTQVF